MLRKFACFSLSLFVSVSSLFAKIVEADSLISFSEYAGSLDTNSLVLFDVDRTLLTPRDAIHSSAGTTLRNQLINETFIDSGLDASFPEHYFWGIFCRDRKAMLVEKMTPSLVRELQRNQIPTLALTAAPGDKVGVIKSAADWRINELKSLGFDFRETFPDIKTLIFAKDKSKTSNPLYKKGIIFTASHSKGEVLEAFLKRIEWKPSKIVFIDDHLHFLESVEEMAKKLEIDYVGIHYHAEKKLTHEIDEKVARYQINHLANQHEWISDKSARAIIYGPSCP